jgi:hypothetical protein
VDVDIKPGSCPNSYNRDGNGMLALAVVGTNDLDVDDIDLSTLEIARVDGLGGSLAPHEGPPGPGSEIEDAATPFPGEACDCHELTGDGILDLSLKFRTQDLVAALELDDASPGDLVALAVRGNLLDGTPFVGSDCVRLVPPGTPPNMLVVQTLEGAWIDVLPLDDQLDGGGFGPSFERSYSESTEVELTAAPEHDGRAFLGWSEDAGELIPSPSLLVSVSGATRTLEAVYAAPPKKKRRCGAGWELVLMLPALTWLQQRRRKHP